MTNFELAGAELSWPIGSAAGLSNHPDIEVVANRIQNLAEAGFSFIPAGSWKLGEPDGGNGYVKTDTGWDYLGGDEYVDLELRAGYNAKGLPGPGTDLGMAHLTDLMDIARSRGAEFALSLSPHTGQPVEELKELVEVGRKALDAGVLYVEVNLSCPNIPDRPPFYMDVEGVTQFYDNLARVAPLRNRHDKPGLYLKFGPVNPENVQPMYRYTSESIGGHIRSNTLGNQTPDHEGENPIKVNNGKAGMSGPALRELGQEQLHMFTFEPVSEIGKKVIGETISVLGIDSGQEVRYRIDRGANAVQIGSIAYWPELLGLETTAEVVDRVKQEFLETYTAA